MDMACLHFLNAATPVVPPPAKLSNTISWGLVNTSISPPIRNSGFSGWMFALSVSRWSDFVI